MIKGIMQSEIFYCSHLGSSNNDEIDIVTFCVDSPIGIGLEKYIKYYAFPDEDSGIMRTYIVRDNDTDEMVGYFSLKAGLISIHESEASDKVEFDTYPGVEIANFAINSNYVKDHPETKGCGLIIFKRFIKPLICNSAKEIGIKIIYIFALPVTNLIDRYYEYGFKRLSDIDEEAIHKRLKPSYDEGCIFMYQVIK